MVTSIGIVLASGSKRRRTLLKQIIPKFRIITPPQLGFKEPRIREAIFSPVAAGRYVCRLARLKAYQIAKRLQDGIIIGADTVVFSKGKIIGKPANRNEARRILKNLAGTRHKVITGVCVINARTGKTATGYAVTLIQMKKLSETEITRLTHLPKHLDKAGGYAIQEDNDTNLKIIRGGLDNAVGLPLNLVQRLIKQVCKN